MKSRVGVVGFRGYSGAELVRLLQRHSHVEPWLLEHRADSEERRLPRGGKQPPRIPATAEAVKEEQVVVVFLATPAEVSMDLAPQMLEVGAKVIDLSGAFRLRTPENYLQWYNAHHTQPSLLAEAVYGLPEFNRDSIAQARLIANPGCYPTAVNLALRPLVEAGVINRKAGVVCDAKSGVSGAGRKPSLKTSFCEVTENLTAYSIFHHRHVPEVLLTSGLEEREFTFTAHLLPVERGILETIYFHMESGVDVNTLMEIYERRYRNEFFVRLYDPGYIPDLKSVAYTNYCDIGFKADASTQRAVVVVTIDNLVKGAAGQAIQNMNLLLGYPETEGIG